MSIPIPSEERRMRYLAMKLDVHSNIVRGRLEMGPPLTAQEVVDGVRLSHEEFLELAALAQDAIKQALRKTG